MRTLSFTEFRKQASSVLDLVEGGEVIAIRRHGKVVARLVPSGRSEHVPAWKQPGLKLDVDVDLSSAVLEDRR